MKKICIAGIITMLAFLYFYGDAAKVLFGACRDEYSVGDEVKYMGDDGKWLNATVIQRNDSHYQIHFPGTSSDDDIWASNCQLTRKEDKSFFGSDRNTREYRLKIEFRYFCERDADQKKIWNAVKRKQFIDQCVEEKNRDVKPQTAKPDLEPWDIKNPRKWNIHQACLGRQYYCSTDDIHQDEDHIYQRFEVIDKCKCSYQYDVIAVEKCSPGAYWNYNPGWSWNFPQLVVDASRMSWVWSCLGPYAKKLNACGKCASLRRCLSVCDIDPSSVDNVKTTAECKKLCNKYHRGCTKDYWIW